jgi:hypothetical protein
MTPMPAAARDREDTSLPEATNPIAAGRTAEGF